MLYLNIDGLTNLAIAEGTVCRFTRVVGSGLEGMAVELAERRGIALTEARELLSAVDLEAGATDDLDEAAELEQDVEPEPAEAADAAETAAAGETGEELDVDPELGAQAPADADEEHLPAAGAAAIEDEPAYDYAYESGQTAATDEPAADTPAVSNADVLAVLENGIREISGEVRNSLDFHRSQEGGGEVSHVVVSGAAADIPGFAEALSLALGVEVRNETVAVAAEALANHVSSHRLAVATGLATSEVPS